MKDFSKKTLKQLANKGITITELQAIPGFDGDKHFTDTGYKLAYKETSFMRTHSQILVLAASSWNPEIDLTNQ